MAGAPPKKQSIPRILFRWTRIVFLACILLLVGIFAWLNLWGLPGFAKRQFQRAAARQGLYFDGDSFKLRGFERLLIRNAHLYGGSKNAPEVRAGRVNAAISLKELLAGNFDLTELRIDDAIVNIPLGSEAEPLQIQEARGALSLDSYGILRVEELKGKALGVSFSGVGTVSNLYHMLHRPKHSSPPTNQVEWQPIVGTIRDFLKNHAGDIQPELKLVFVTDAANPEFGKAKLHLDASGAQGNWGHAGSLTAHLSLSPNADKTAIVGEGAVDLHIAQFATSSVHDLAGKFTISWPMRSNTLPHIQAAADVRIAKLGAVQASTAFLTLTAGETNASYAGDLEVRAADVAISRAKVQTLTAAVRLRKELTDSHQLTVSNMLGTFEVSASNIILTNTTISSGIAKGSFTNSPATQEVEFGKLTFLKDWLAQTAVELSGVKVAEIEIPAVTISSEWHAPDLLVREVKTEVLGSELFGTTSFNVTNLTANSQVQLHVDVAGLKPLLDASAHTYLDHWSSPGRTKIELQINTQLPRGASSAAELWSGTRSNLLAKGNLTTAGKYKELQVESLRGDIEFTNDLLRIPQLELLLPDGSANLGAQFELPTQNFVVYLNSHLNPAAFDSLLEGEAKIALSMVRFSAAPELEGELRGKIGEVESLQFTGKARARNFSIKKEPFADLETKLAYTNGVITCTDILAHRVAGEEVRAPEAIVEIEKKIMRVRDVVSTMNPYIAMKLVGPVVLKAIEPYQFAIPPRVTVNGIVPLSDPPKAADLRFEVTGKQFTYWRFHMSDASAYVHWKGDHLWVTNVVGPFYGGQLDWHGYFFFNDNDSADYNFEGRVRDVNARLLLNDILTGTNKMEGTLNGRMVITSANSDDFGTWAGFGSATLRDGFLWDMPIFGLFTPMLEAISPGLGVSRIKSGSASFTITNSTVLTRDLEVRAPAFRLAYDGQVDFDGKLKARMEARLLRDTWIVGRVISATLSPLSKLFEAEISGTLEAPKSEFRHFPGFVSGALKPVKALRDALRGAQRPPKRITPLQDAEKIE